MAHGSFLPDDYLAQKHERRTNLICLTLFGVVMTAVFGAFLVTNRQWVQVKAAQERINSQYQDAAAKIEKLNELEKQKEQMLNKAELAAALVERVPRSILLAELINRMPQQLSLLDFELKSDRVKKVVKATDDKAGEGRLGSAQPARAKTKEEAAVEQKKIEPPKYGVTISMTGVAPTDMELSRYMAELNGYPLLRGVTLDYSEQKELQEQMMRRFSIKMTLNGDADVRDVQPLVRPRTPRDPMSDEFELKRTGSGNSVFVLPGGKGAPDGHDGK